MTAVVLRAAALLAAGLLAACLPAAPPTAGMPPGTPPSAVKDAERILDKASGLPASSKTRVQTLGSDAEAAAAFLSGTTARSYSFSHGSQIEYLGGDGTTFLWYPGNRAPVAGHWKTEQHGSRASMCFLYGPSSFNPVTKTLGGNWECEPLRVYLLVLEELVAGDPLRLAAGRLPFTLPRANISIAQAMKQAGLPGKPDNKIDW